MKGGLGRAQEVAKPLQGDRFAEACSRRADPPLLTVVDPWWTRAKAGPCTVVRTEVGPGICARDECGIIRWSRLRPCPLARFAKARAASPDAPALRPERSPDQRRRWLPLGESRGRPAVGEDQGRDQLQPRTCSADRVVLPLRRGETVRRPVRGPASAITWRRRRG